MELAGNMSRVLLHVCCGNCAIYPVKVLRERNLHVDGYFFNNNIHPYTEFRRRLETAVEYAEKVNLDLIVREEYLLEEFLANVATDPEKRCGYCYTSRMEEAARYAAENHYDYFSSSLLYSRYQNHEMMKQIGEELAVKYGIGFWYEDFRVGWQEGIKLSKGMELYRQQYCGCIYSEKERYYKEPKVVEGAKA